MRRIVMAAAVLLLFPAMGHGQAASGSDSQTLQELLKEMRLLRQDLRTVTATSERAQVVLSRLQTQQTAVGGAQQRLDAAQERLSQAQTRRRDLENEIKHYTDLDNEDSTPDATQRQRIEQYLTRAKASVDEASADEQAQQSSTMQARDKLQIEQGKLDALQSELDQLDKVLAQMASQPVN